MSTPNMSLTLPAVSQTPGPQWASEINSDLSLIDSHDHTAGKGLPVPVAGLLINDDLGLGGVYGLEQASFLSLSPQAVAPAGATRLYSNSSGNLFYNNDSGTPVQITNGASVVPGVSGSIAGLSPPAAADYNNGTSTFSFYSDQGLSQYGSVEHGPLLVHTGIAGSPGLQIQPSASMALGYTLTLPPTLPASVPSFAATDTFGVQSNVAPDNSTIEINSSTLRVKSLGIDTAQIDNLAVTTGKIDNGAVTQEKLASAIFNQSSLDSGTYSVAITSSPPVAVTNLITTISLVANRPTLITIQPSILSPTNDAYLRAQTNHSALFFRLTYGAGPTVTNVGRIEIDTGAYFPPSSLTAWYLPTFSGTHTIEVYANSLTGTSTLSVYYCRLFVYQV